MKAVIKFDSPSGEEQLTDLILSALDSTGDEFIKIMEMCIKRAINIVHESKELQDEFQMYGDLVFHLYFKDEEYNIWINNTQGKLEYCNSMLDRWSEDHPTIHYVLSKMSFKKLVRREMTGAEAYMKGLIQIEGNLSKAIITKNLIKAFFTYLNYFSKNE